VSVKLHATTGIDYLDTLLANLVTHFEQSFPARIRSYYLGGSSSDGTAAGYDQSPNSSDVDLFVIFYGTITEDESATFRRFVAECQRTGSIQIDAHAYSEDDLLRGPGSQTSFLNVLIREASILLYGDDLRADLPHVQFSHYILDVIASGVFHMGIPRQRERLVYPLVTPLVFPLTCPDPTGEFYGYDVVPARPDAPRGTRVLVAITTWIATLILALETRRFAAQKSQCIRQCKEHLPHDKRTQLAMIIYEMCKGTWGYGLPEHATDRERLHELCRDTLALENEYLRLVHNYLLVQLQQGDEHGRQQALHILHSVIYQDNEIMAALETLTHNTDEAMQISTAKALEILKQNIRT
jgi:hypothetical protein